MKKIIILLGIVTLSACSDPSKFAEFYVDDVSKEQIFIDSITGTGFKLIPYHVLLEASIEGELDSSADVSFYYYPSNERARTLDLRKEDNLMQKTDGTIPFHTTKFDFYGDTLLIRYVPKGATKGHLKIRTNIR
jgi:hypothetical protein